MAAVDKCYTSSFKDYIDFKDWANDKSFVTPRGCKINVRDYVYDWWEEKDFIVDGKPYERPIFNTPTYVDNYLYKNCPLKFVRDWLEDSYRGSGYCKGVSDEISGELSLPIFVPCTKVKVIQKGFGNNPPRAWFVEIRKKGEGYCNDCWYNEKYDFWTLPNEEDEWTSSAMHHRGSIRALIRKIIKKWKIPTGYIITVKGNYVEDTWILKTK